MGGPRPRSWASIGLPSYCLSRLLGRMGGPRPRSWGRVGLPSCFLLSAKELGAPFIFPFWAPGSDGWAAAKKLGSRWAPFMFPSFWVLGSQYFLSALLGRMGGPRPGLSLGSLHGWVGRGQRTRRPSCFLSGLLGLFVLPPRMNGPRSQGWAPMASLRSQGCSHH